MVEIENKTELNNLEEAISGQSTNLLDEAVAEVFGMMFGFAIEAVTDPLIADKPLGQPQKAAIVGFSGTMRGSCGIRLTSLAATAVTSAMLGGDTVSEEDGSVDDAVGELCNMLAGGWKNRLPGSAASCMLSPPAVITGSDYKIHMGTDAIRFSRVYQFGEHMLHLTVVRYQQTRS